MSLATPAMHGRRVLGRLADTFIAPADFDAPLPPDVLDTFGGALMRLLPDTHVLLWALGDPAAWTAPRDPLEDAAHDVPFSAASIWEVVIKTSLGRLGFTARPEQVVREARATGSWSCPSPPRLLLK